MAKLDALLMPSAVAPSPDTPFQALLDPRIRLNQTLKAISYWVSKAHAFDFRIMVVDNTNFAQEIKSALPQKVRNSKLLEVLDVPPLSPQDIQRGKGAGETSTLLAGLALLNLPAKNVVSTESKRGRGHAAKSKSSSSSSIKYRPFVAMYLALTFATTEFAGRSSNASPAKRVEVSPAPLPL